MFHVKQFSLTESVSFSSRSALAMCLSALGLFLWCLGLPLVATAQEAVEHKGFHYFSMDVPKGWYVHEDKEVITFTEPQKKCSVTVLVLPQMEIEFRELGISFFQNLQGYAPSGEDGGMSFAMKTENDVPAFVRLASNEGYFSAITAMGQCKSHEYIFESLLILDEKGIVVPITSRIHPLLDDKPKAQPAPSKPASKP